MIDNEELLKKTYNLALNNNKMIRSMKRTAFFGRIFKILLYAIILGISVYSYFTFLQPILNNLLNTYSQIQQVGTQLQNESKQLNEITSSISPDKIKEFFKSLPKLNNQ